MLFAASFASKCAVGARAESPVSSTHACPTQNRSRQTSLQADLDQRHCLFAESGFARFLFHRSRRSLCQCAARAHRCAAHGQGQDEALLHTAARHSARVVRYQGPFHFGRMCNIAARDHATAEYLLFLNDDVTPLKDDWLQWMHTQAQRPNTGAVGALLHFPDGRIQHAGVMIGTPNGAGHPGRLSNGSPLWPWLTITREVSAVTGACLLMPRAVFNKIDGFDEIFPVNYNDVDLCLRTAKAGYRIILEARAILEHAESATRVIGIRYAERQRFLERWGDLLAQGDPFFNPNLTDNELLLPDAEAHTRMEAKHHG